MTRNENTCKTSRYYCRHLGNHFQTVLGTIVPTALSNTQPPASQPREVQIPSSPSATTRPAPPHPLCSGTNSSCGLSGTPSLQNTYSQFQLHQKEGLMKSFYSSYNKIIKMDYCELSSCNNHYQIRTSRAREITIFDLIQSLIIYDWSEYEIIYLNPEFVGSS